MIINTHHQPKLEEGVFIAPSAVVSGQVTLNPYVNIWHGAVLRGDWDAIIIGSYTNIQDNAVCHQDVNTPLIIGDYCTIGHSAIVHGATIGDYSLIGMGAIIMNRTTIGHHCIIGAGSLVTEDKVIPPYSLVMGFPAKIIREVTPQEIEKIINNAKAYVQKAKETAPYCQ